MEQPLVDRLQLCAGVDDLGEATFGCGLDLLPVIIRLLGLGGEATLTASSSCCCFHPGAPGGSFTEDPLPPAFLPEVVDFPFFWESGAPPPFFPAEDVVLDPPDFSFGSGGWFLWPLGISKKKDVI